MGDVITEVNDTLTAISKVMEGAAKKEEQMKDGPPESQEPKPEGGTKTAYDKFKEDSAKAWSNYDKHGDRIQLGLEIGQAVADFAMRAGPGALESLAKLKGK